MVLSVRSAAVSSTTLLENSTANRTLTLPDNTGFLTSIQNTTPSTTLFTSAHTADRTIALPDRNCTLTDGIQRGTSQSLSGLSFVDYTIPSYVRKITVSFSSCSSSSAGNPIIRLGTSAGIVTTDYASSVGTYNSSAVNLVTYTNGIYLLNASASHGSYVGNGEVSFYNMNGNFWLAGGIASWTFTTGNISVLSGTSTLSSILTTVRITTSNGETFDQGTVNVFYE